VSRLAKVDCRGPETPCSCPWESLATCPTGCAAEGLQVVIDREQAVAQLCAPLRDASIITWSPDGGSEEVRCESEELYRCARGAVVDCAAHSVIAYCVRGCFAEGATIDEAAVRRETAFAILCSR
jgi:hypothetical protein